MQDFFELLVSAVSTGCIYGLVALAYLLIARPTGIINFAVGEWAALGGFAGYLALSKFELPYAVGMAVVVIFMFCAGGATERTVVRPLIERHAPPLAPVLVLLGMLVIFRESFSLGFSPAPYNLPPLLFLFRDSLSLGFGPDPYSVPAGLGFGRFKFGLFAGAYQSLFIIATALTIFAAAWLFFERSLTGKSFAAVAIDRRVAALMGIDLGRVTSMSFAGGAVVAGMAGLLSAPTTSVHYMMGLPLAIQGFTALVIGGANRVAGALFGGLL